MLNLNSKLKLKWKEHISNKLKQKKKKNWILKVPEIVLIS